MVTCGAVFGRVFCGISGVALTQQHFVTERHFPHSTCAPAPDRVHGVLPHGSGARASLEATRWRSPWSSSCRRCSSNSQNSSNSGSTSNNSSGLREHHLSRSYLQEEKSLRISLIEYHSLQMKTSGWNNCPDKMDKTSNP